MEILLPSIALAIIIVIGYIFAWYRDIPKLGVCLILMTTIILAFNTDFSVLVHSSGATGWARIMEMGPALMMAASVTIGFVYAWMHRPLHVLICVMLAVCSLVLGW